MIFGIAPQFERLPFQRPAAAGYYTPQLPQTAFFTHLRPFATMAPVQAFAPNVPGMPTNMAPGIVRFQRMPSGSPEASPDMDLPKAAPVPGVPTGMEGFRGARGFGHNFWRR